MHGTNSRTKILNDIVALLPQVVPKADLLLSFNPNPAPRSEVACLGVTPAWRYQAINNFTWDFYDSGDNFINRQTNSSPDFASDYELLAQAMHHEIEWFFATTFRSIGTSPYRVTGEPVERDMIQPLVFRASVWWSPFTRSQATANTPRRGIARGYTARDSHVAK